MPRPRRRAATVQEEEEGAVEEQQVEEQPEDVMQDPAHTLQFNEPLTWRAGKPIAVSELLRRLKALYKELVPLEQDEADRETLVPKAQELANVQLLGHKDKGVKAWALLNIVQMFKLLAPDAPYKGAQLKQIFELFVSTVIPALVSPTDPYNQQHFLILTSLTTVKSIVLLTDIPGSDTLILKLFTNCFDVMTGNIKGGQGEQLGKNVEYHMTNMLCTLVDECPTLPNDVVDIILAQFLRADPTTLSSVDKKGSGSDSSLVTPQVSPAYNMARFVCNTCAEKMSRAVGQYFSSVLIDASENFSTTKASKPRGRKRTHDESEDESDDGMLTPPAEDDIREVEKAHRLLREMWRSSPDIVRNIIPQMEAEVGADNVQLRTMAVQTVGDMIAGIGAVGPPPPALLNPAAYPSQSLEMPSTNTQHENPLLVPAAPHAFSSVYPAAYKSFVDRRRDKYAQVRSAWATAAGRIISTNGGGKGLDSGQEAEILRYLADMLVDSDERVRLAAVQAVSQFDFDTFVEKLGQNGGVETQGSVLYYLNERSKDPKHNVRVAAMEVLARIWGVAAGAIAEGRDRVRNLLGPIPTNILNTVYINDRELNALVQRVLYDSLLPIGFPPLKAKHSTTKSQRVTDSQIVQDELDPDAIRAERILVLIRDLDEKAAKVFFALQRQAVGKAKYMDKYLTACTSVYGDPIDDEQPDEKAAKKELNTMIDALSKLDSDPPTAAENLKKFAKHHDKRSYQLIRFCYAADSDYRKIIKAIKELVKRFDDAPSNMLSVLDTILPLTRSMSNLVYNRSHMPTIMAIARSDDKGLGNAAHDILKQISADAPDVFRVHIREMCDGLRKQAPSAAAPNQRSAVDELKACAGFAQRYPEDLPKDREFYKAMTAFAKYGSPPEAAKHAVTVIVASADKKEMYIKDILEYAIADFEYGAECFLARLAAISQLRLVANKETEEYADQIMTIVAAQVLGEVRTMDEDNEALWTDEIDDDLAAKLWAIKILVNGLRGMHGDDTDEAKQALSIAAGKIYKLLNTIIEKDGEVSKTATTAQHHRAHLRLAAANQLLKLSCNKTMDQYLLPGDFNRLARIAQDPLPQVRGGFVRTLRKYLGQAKLPNRFYAIVFLYAHEPVRAILTPTATWLKARASISVRAKDTAIESVFARFLSLLAHHQDFSAEAADLEEFVEYIMFYLKTVATQENLPMIYHLAQRLKAVQDGIDPDKSENLYVMSDLAEATIRYYQDIQGWSLQLYPAKARMPSGIFAALPSHVIAQEIAEKNYIPADLVDKLEDLVKASLRTKKRKAEGSTKPPAKKAKVAAEDLDKKKLPPRKTSKVTKTAKTPRKKSVDAIPSSERRKSTRALNVKNYAEDSDDSAEEGAEQLVISSDNDHDEQESNKENVTESTPPTSDPMPEVEKQSSTIKVARPPTKAKPEKKVQKRAVQRSTRATRGKKREERDVMDIPSDSEAELSEAPSKMET
ncbi:hypothetical protein LTR62_002908 [Meristemomyces frigidus]|uniref:Sister chromatid cohesion protein n=1 Tax=Meristemomyces frigidus TaxID=1508187 RepID=A0AAN7TJS1_9PEZI|nr:hypothetical protein LTR62_002908 [Meristemomyces frigidus]